MNFQKNKFLWFIKTRLVQLGFVAKPKFIIAGAQKSGTTALFNILSQHKDILPPIKKELNYFNNDPIYNKYKNKLRYYHSYFSVSLPFSKKIGLESTPLYLYHPDVARRIYSYNPNIKIIIVLRDPVKRLISAWNFYRSKHPDVFYQYYPKNITLSELINGDIRNFENINYNSNPISLLRVGVYYEQLQRFFEQFSKDQILVLDYDQLKSNYDLVIREILDFLGLSFEEIPNLKANITQKYDFSIYNTEVDLLKEFYKPFNKSLFELLGKEFSWTT